MAQIVHRSVKFLDHIHASLCIEKDNLIGAMEQIYLSVACTDNSYRLDKNNLSVGTPLMVDNIVIVILIHKRTSLIEYNL